MKELLIEKITLDWKDYCMRAEAIICVDGNIETATRLFITLPFDDMDKSARAPITDCYHAIKRMAIAALEGVTTDANNGD